MSDVIKKLYVLGGTPSFIRLMQRHFSEKGYAFNSFETGKGALSHIARDASMGVRQAVLVADPAYAGLLAELSGSPVALLSSGVPADQLGDTNKSVLPLDNAQYGDYPALADRALEVALLRKLDITRGESNIQR